MSSKINNNPLITINQFPDYDKIKPKDALPAIKYLCKTAKSQLNKLLKIAEPNWDVYEQIEFIDDKLNKAWTSISHLHSVMNNDSWREAYQDCLPIISQYEAEMSQHKELYLFYCQLRDNKDSAYYNDSQKKLINDAIYNFELAGVNLPEQKKIKYQKLIKSANNLCTTFANNVLDATQSFHLHITDKELLTGIPDSAIDLYSQLAAQNNVKGFWITLDIPSYLPALTYAVNRSLREKLYYAYNIRASELDNNDYDNTKIIEQIITVRAHLAKLLGFDNYADLSLANKMAKSPEKVLLFLYDLVEKSKRQGKQEYKELVAYGKKHLNIDNIQPWDIAYISEKIKQDKYSISQEQLRSYFPIAKVIEGLFVIVEKLFKVKFVVNNKLSKWHKDVQIYTVKDLKNKEIAYFYMDLYSRNNKNSGAWMNSAINKINSKFIQQNPVAYLVCNFIPPTANKPAYLSHDEVVTLFHEFGHGLHQMLTTVPYSPLSGINGVEWDAIELPSQFMENFCFQYEVLKSMSSHMDSGKTLPEDLFNKLTAAKNFHSALMMLRQLEFSLFDIKVHAQCNSSSKFDAMSIWQKVRCDIAVTPIAEYVRFPMSFSHIFSGGYAAGYFSYKWAEVLSADAFAYFEKKGVYNDKISMAFKKEILQRGASRTAMQNFLAFRGREPNINALLNYNGIVSC